MKNIFYLLILISTFLYIKEVKAQGFTYIPLGPTYVYYPYNSADTPVVKHQAIIRNTSSSPLNFKFARILNALPSGFETQMCYDLCYAPFVDTISLPGDPPYNIPPGHQDTLFYIDFTCVGQGLGTSVVRMFNTDNPAMYVQDTFSVQIGSVGITPISTIAGSYSLSQNYPNPFNPFTVIDFIIPAPQVVSLKVFDVLGNEISNLVNNERLVTGMYKINFNGSKLSSGIYYYTIKMENFTDTKKMILVK